jgi:hypothetical protein
MSNSSLVTYTKLSPHRNKPRNHVIDTITIHCYVGQVTAKRGCDGFAKPLRFASCNYVVGYDGSIGLCVEEANRSWCTSSRSNDHRAVTIEVACETKHPYTVTEKAYAALLDLVTDICKRNNIKELKWKADKKLIGKVDQQNMTVHRWFANKACPGDYLYNKHGEIAAEVNKRLGVAEPKKEETKPAAFKPYRIKVTKPPVNIRKAAGTNNRVVGKITDYGVYTIVEEAQGNTKFPWGKLKSGAGWITLSPSFVKKI